MAVASAAAGSRAAPAARLRVRVGVRVSVGDIDADGWPDLVVRNGTGGEDFSADGTRNTWLLRNQGDGTFADVTAEAGVGDSRMSTSAAFADYDGDGALDLYVANNAEVPIADAKECRHGVVKVYCGPGQYEGVTGVLYHNEGDGSFVDMAGGPHQLHRRGLFRASLIRAL